VNEGHGWEKKPKIGGDPSSTNPPHPKPHIFGGFSYYIGRASYFMNISLRKEKRSYTYYLRGMKNHISRHRKRKLIDYIF
jgi:hypothetical protein